MGLPIEPPAEGWTVQEIITLAAMTKRMAFQSVYNAATAGCTSDEAEQFYLKRTGKEFDAVMEVTSGRIADWAKSDHPENYSFRIQCEEDLELPAKIILLDD
jgi:hypothetical protein